MKGNENTIFFGCFFAAVVYKREGGEIEELKKTCALICSL